MDDRELLELAAKAVGYERNSAGPIGPCEWNPLIDDGDALRLAVSLNIDVLQRVTTPAEVWAQAPMQRTIIEPIGRDRLAATRRAIVRAAAELQHQKENK